MVIAWRSAWILDFGSAWINEDRRLWWVVFGLVSCVGRGSGGGFGVVGQMMDLDRWINVSWIRWWRGFGLVEIGGFRSVEIGGFLGVIGVGFWILDLGSAWISGNRRSWWHGFGLAAIGDRAVLCVVCVALSIAPMVIFFFFF